MNGSNLNNHMSHTHDVAASLTDEKMDVPPCNIGNNHKIQHGEWQQVDNVLKFWLRSPWMESIVSTCFMSYGRYYINLSDRTASLSLLKPENCIPCHILLSANEYFSLLYNLKDVHPIIQLLEVVIVSFMALL